MSNLSVNLQSTTRIQRGGESINNFDAGGDEQTISGQIDTPARLDKNYIVRYKEILNEAKSQFVQDLCYLQLELQNSRKLFIQLHKEKLEQRGDIESFKNQIEVKQSVIENQ